MALDPNAHLMAILAQAKAEQDRRYADTDEQAAWQAQQQAARAQILQMSQTSQPVVAPPATPTGPAYPMARPLDPGVMVDLAQAQHGMGGPQLSRLGFSSSGPTAGDLGEPIFRKAAAASDSAEAGIANDAGQLQQANSEEQLGTQQLLDARVASNQEFDTLARNKSEISDTHSAKIKEMWKEAEAQTAVQMAKVQQASQEAANAQVKDFWADKTTGGRIMGIISSALAGAANGLSGQPGAPTPLDRIIDRDLEIQKTNLNNKVATSYREQGILGLMYNSFNSAAEAETAAYKAALNHVDMQIEQVKQLYDTPVALAEATKAHAALQAKAADADNKLQQELNQSAIQKMQISGLMVGRSESANAAFDAAQTRAKGQGNDQHILGLRGTVNKQVFSSLQKHAGAVGSMLNAYEGVQDLLGSGQKLDLDWRRKFNAYRSQIFAALRSEDETGAALNAREAENLETRVPEITQELLGHLSHNTLLNYKAQLDSMRNAVLGGYLARAKAVSGADYDFKDPLIGKYIVGLAKPSEAK